MLNQNDESGLIHPFASAPAAARVIEAAPGLLWARIPLPFHLDHVNIYLIEDGDGWAIVDTGIDSSTAREVWECLIDGPLAGRRLTRLIVTHHHPDHIGLAGWLCERFGIPLLTSQSSYLGCLNISLSPDALNARPYHDFYKRHGMDAAAATLMTSTGRRYLKMVAPLPHTFVRVVGGDVLRIGAREFLVLTGDGHAAEQLMLYAASDNILLAADQVIAGISPNISVWAFDPEGDPLGLFLRSLESLTAQIPAKALVLPGHQLPFHGLHERCRQLRSHHMSRCAMIEAACRQRPRSIADLVPVVFSRALDARELNFAFGEVHAHVNFMINRGQLVRVIEKERILHFVVDS